MPGLYRYQKDGQEVLIGDPTINRSMLEGSTFVGRQGDPAATDPLLAFPRYSPPTSTGTPTSPRSAAGDMFAAGGALSTLKPYSPQDEEAVREAERQRVQKIIDSISSSAAAVREQALTEGQDRLGRVRAGSAATGTLGTPMGDTRTEKVGQYNAKELQLIEDEKNAKIQAALIGAEDRASKIIKDRRDEARSNSAEYLSYLKSVSDQALGSFKNLATAGISYDDALSKDPVNFRSMLDQSGLTELEAKAIFISNAPQKGVGSIINKDKPQIIGNKAVFFQQDIDKATGQMTLKTVTLDLPQEMVKNKEIDSTVSRDDGIYVFYKDGTWNKVGEPKPGTATTQNTSTLQSQFDAANNALTKAKELAYASGRGRSWLEGVRQGTFGATDYTNLESYANTLRTSVLALATDPNVKKFFGPQMSNADVQLMTAAGTSLNPELMDPEQFTNELNRLDELFTRLAKAKGTTFEDTSGTVLMTSPDGKTQYEVPSAKVDEFINNGYKRSN